MTLDIDKMTLQEIKDILKMIARNMNYEHERLNVLQERVLALEINNKTRAEN